MTTTEEQREAIRDVSDLPRAIGCTQCHSYIQEHYGNQFAILRAMIDSSDHIVEPDELIGFDLERARGLRDFLQDDCAEVGDVWAEMIAEIERLRSEKAFLEKVVHIKNTRLKELEADLEEAQESLTEAYLLGSHEKAKELASRIKELEDAHKRSGVKYAKIINELRSSVYANIPGLDVGKIGPDDSALNADHEYPPERTRSWQITDERKEALQAMGNMKTLIVCPHCKTPIEFVDIPRYMAVLRAMLEGNL